MRALIRNNKNQIINLYKNGASPTEICRDFCIPSSTLYYWIRHETSSKENPRETLKSIHKLQSHSEKQSAQIRFLQRTLVSKLSTRDKMAIVDGEFGKESLHVQCEALNLSRGTYLNHQRRNKRENSWFKLREAQITKTVLDIYENSGHIYGAKKITAIMRSKGETVSYEYVSRVMRKNGIRSCRSNSCRDYYYNDIASKISGRAVRSFKITGINQVWATDTTSILVNKRYYWVCAYIDMFSRRVVGWKVGPSNSTHLVKSCFEKAFSLRHPKGLIVHSDNGSCYKAYSFEKFLREHGVNHSFSRPGAPHDNAVAESFFNTLKREGIFHFGYPKSLNELTNVVNAFMEQYNSIRPHSSLNFKSPVAFEEAQ